MTRVQIDFFVSRLTLIFLVLVAAAATAFAEAEGVRVTVSVAAAVDQRQVGSLTKIFTFSQTLGPCNATEKNATLRCPDQDLQHFFKGN